jgi:HlyD family secretion protein
MTAKVDILTATSEDALTIPVQAVVKRKLGDDGAELRGSDAKGVEDTDVVYLIGEDGKAEVRAVSTGVSDVLAVEILDGLSEGDEVVVGPYRTLKSLHAGETIRAEEEKGEEADDAKAADDEEGSGDAEVRVE